MRQPPATLYLAIISCLVRSLHSQDAALLTLSDTPVYSGQAVMLTCTYGAGRIPVSVTIDAFNGTQRTGVLSCKTPSSNTTGTGVFRGKHFQGCPAVPVGSTNVSLSMTAYPLLQLDFNCTVIVTDDDGRRLTLISNMASLKVRVLPTTPRIAPNPSVFAESDNAAVDCESRHGEPPSFVRLTVASSHGTEISSTESEFTSLTLPLPLHYWHNATVKCVVTNHNFANMSSMLIIEINHRRRKICQNFQIQMENNNLYVPLYDLKSTAATTAQPKKSDLVFYGLLIADKGAIAELSPMVLPTTVVMEYSAGYEALNEILVSLSQSIDLPTTPKFTSVGLFLPPVKHWVHDGEENQTSIINTNLTSENVLTLEHFALLAEMCLTQQSGCRGLDMFNYSGPDAASLAGMLTGALKVPVTVSYGYGIGATKDLKKLHASSAAKYFSFLRLATTTNQSVNKYVHSANAS